MDKFIENGQISVWLGGAMGQKLLNLILQVEGMTCSGCELRIENTIKKLNGVKKVNASYSKAIVNITYEADTIRSEEIIKTIEKLDYSIKNAPVAQIKDAKGNKDSKSNTKRVIRKVLQISGISGTESESKVEITLKKLNGVIDANVMSNSSNVYITYNANEITLESIIDSIEKMEYRVINKPQGQDAPEKKKDRTGHITKTKKTQINQLLGIGIIILAVYVIINNTIGFNFSFIPQINQSMGYGILFIVGLITSIHCVAMCGGINLSQCVSYKQNGEYTGNLSKLKPSFMYNTGRVISYTILGGVFGALGSVVSFSSITKGIIGILAGLFMVIMGLNMLNIFPWLKKLNPRMPKIFARKINNGKKQHGPLIVGLFNGLMPCGPLQSMQLYALGTGSFFAGAFSMFMFSIGTVPLMFGFGAIGSLLNSKFTHKMMKVSAVLVLILGILMLNRGLNLSGINIIAYASPQPVNAGNVAKISSNTQLIETKLQPNSYTPIIVQKGVPVKWNIKANESDINGCNGTLTIPKYNIVKQLQTGDNIIEFTPDSEGNITYTCSMGMITSVIKVVSDVANVSSSDIAQANSSANGIGSSGGCCGPTPPAFAGGKIPTDNIKIAQQINGQQIATVTVNSQGYSPAVIVLQKGIPAIIKFNPEQLSACNGTVVFPEYQGQLDLQSGQIETPELTPTQDFTFQCSMGMLHGYVKVVDDINNINLEDIKNTVKNYKPASTGSAGCH